MVTTLPCDRVVKIKSHLLRTLFSLSPWDHLFYMTIKPSATNRCIHGYLCFSLQLSLYPADQKNISTLKETKNLSLLPFGKKQPYVFGSILIIYSKAEKVKQNRRENSNFFGLTQTLCQHLDLWFSRYNLIEIRGE